MSEADPDGIEEQFAEIAERLEADTGAIRTVDVGSVPGVMPEMRLSLEKLREKLMELIVNHMIEIGEVDASDEAALNAAADSILDDINEKFEDMSELEFGDVIVASGETIIMFVEMSNDVITACSIAGTAGVIGQAMSFAVIEIPQITALKDMNEGRQFDLDRNPVPINPLGLGLVLANARSIEGDSDWFNNGDIVIVPLNYPQLVLEKIILPAQD